MNETLTSYNCAMFSRAKNKKKTQSCKMDDKLLGFGVGKWFGSEQRKKAFIHK